MLNKLHQEGNHLELEQLQKEEQKELEEVSALPFWKRLKETTKIKQKYYRLKNDTYRNNYLEVS